MTSFQPKHHIYVTYLIRSLNSIASKVIQHVHETFNNTRSSLAQITNSIEFIHSSGVDWPCPIQCKQEVYTINPKPCLSFP